MKKQPRGFTIVELLIVIVVIGILAAIVTVAYNGVNSKAVTAKRQADTSLLLKAITAARNNVDKTLLQITGSSWSMGDCQGSSANPSGTEPRLLSKTHACWTRYYNDLNLIGAAANMNLNALREGDSRGNPYMFDENEGEAGNNCSTDSGIFYFTGSGITTGQLYSIPKYLPPC